MELYEIVFYIFFLLIMIALAIGIYFYNKRHKNIFKDELQGSYNHKQKDKIIEFKKSAKFNWDLYEDDLCEDDKKFIGLDIWDQRVTALLRIKEIKEEFANNDFVLFHMIEILLLIESYGKEVILNDNGEFVISKLYLSSFIDSLEYNIELINKLDLIKTEYIETNKNVEIDAKEILFIMKNAKSFGLGNIKNQSQFFHFINKKKDNLIVDNIDTSGDNFIKILTEENIKLDNHNSNIIDDVSTKDSLSKILNSLKKDMKTRILSDGCFEITYPDGTIIIKDGPWDIKEVITPEDKLTDTKKINISNEAEKLFNDIDNIIKPDEKEKILVPDTKINILNRKEMMEFQYKLLLELNVTSQNNIYFKTPNGEKSFFNYFGIIETLEEFDKAIMQLDQNNLLSILSIVMDNNFIFKEINYLDTTLLNFSFFLTDGQKYYIVYEYFIYMLLQLIENKDKFLENNLLINKTSFSMRFPVKIVNSFIESYQSKFNNNIFYTKETKYYFYKHFSVADKLFKANLLILDFHIIEYIVKNNATLLKNALEINELSKDDISNYKKNNNVIHPIYFNTFKNNNYTEDKI